VLETLKILKKRRARLLRAVDRHPSDSALDLLEPFVSPKYSVRKFRAASSGPTAANSTSKATAGRLRISGLHLKWLWKRENVDDLCNFFAVIDLAEVADIVFEVEEVQKQTELEHHENEYGKRAQVMIDEKVKGREIIDCTISSIRA
jgi:hypothetical protein